MNLEAALALAAAGLPVFPCDFHKRPAAGCRWTRSASAYANCVTGMWDCFGMDCMPGIHVGKVGLVVVDLDRHEGKPDGVRAFDQLLDQHGELPTCPTIESPSGGFHLYFSQPAGRMLGTRRGSLPNGIDIKGFGGYVIGPGAVRDDGTFYGNVAGTPDLIDSFIAGTIPECPGFLVELIEAGSYKPQLLESSLNGCPFQPVTNGDRLRKWALAALDRLTRELAGTTCGRNAKLNRSAFEAAGLAHLGLTDGEVWDALSWACLMNGWIAKDGLNAFRATFISGWRSGLQRPLPGPRDWPEVDTSQIQLKVKS